MQGFTCTSFKRHDHYKLESFGAKARRGHEGSGFGDNRFGRNRKQNILSWSLNWDRKSNLGVKTAMVKGVISLQIKC